MGSNAPTDIQQLVLALPSPGSDHHAQFLCSGLGDLNAMIALGIYNI
ncbi:hypothetical protein I8752_21185 [Nostocaceae cyanobacterium CENA369]|uniref:Uncharacterized protein n=1 Tax=Dendronalium phyllosphericum CENA369 TaxID=1725256 RepID=A0A8J7I762_9NOST|nr:hypothetical protein [Dendronalium phyllosphericum]MBH8575478.1 hypothetical protein [Dendronalium phyllosphericum CENA369]